MPYTTVEVEVNLDDFETEDLVKELERRSGMTELPGEVKKILSRIHQARLTGQHWEDELDRFLKDVLGRAI